jgi:hypothetical protein
VSATKQTLNLVEASRRVQARRRAVANLTLVMQLQGHEVSWAEAERLHDELASLGWAPVA